MAINKVLVGYQIADPERVLGTKEVEFGAYKSLEAFATEGDAIQVAKELLERLPEAPPRVRLPDYTQWRVADTNIVVTVGGEYTAVTKHTIYSKQTVKRVYKQETREIDGLEYIRCWYEDDVIHPWSPLEDKTEGVPHIVEQSLYIAKREYEVLV